MISQNSANGVWYKIRKNAQYESDREFWDLSRKQKYAPIQPTAQELWSLKFGGGVSSGQIKPSGQVWTLSPHSKEFWENPEYQIPREFYNISNGR
jgi:hypothetical protein